MADKKPRTITAKKAAATPPLFVERQEGVVATFGKVSFHIEGLTSQEEERCATILQLMVGNTRRAAQEREEEAQPEDFDYQIETLWRLRFGVHKIEGLDFEPKMKELTVGGQKRMVYDASVFTNMRSAVKLALYVKIMELSNLDEDEEVKLIFTSPPPES